MAGKSQYSEADKARVFVALTTNEGNVKRTSRETGMPESTVRAWKREFEENPPSVEHIEAAAGEWMEDARRVQHKALLEIERQIDAKELKGSPLVTAFGVITDKITRVEAIDRTPRVDHFHHLPSADEVRGLLGGLRNAAIEQAAQRQAELVDAELVEQAPKALPVRTD